MDSEQDILEFYAEQDRRMNAEVWNSKVEAVGHSGHVTGYVCRRPIIFIFIYIASIGSVFLES
jgi:hypothetical protein